MQRLAVHPLVSALLCAGMMALCVPLAVAQTPIPIKELRAAISLNGQGVGSWTLLDRSGVLYASQEAFEAWQIRRRLGAEGISHAGQTWYPLASVPGFEASQNFAAQTLRLQFSSQAVIGPPRVALPTASAATPAAPFKNAGSRQ